MTFQETEESATRSPILSGLDHGPFDAISTRVSVFFRFLLHFSTLHDSQKLISVFELDTQLDLSWVAELANYYTYHKSR